MHPHLRTHLTLQLLETPLELVVVEGHLHGEAGLLVEALRAPGRPLQIHDPWPRGKLFPESSQPPRKPRNGKERRWERKPTAPSRDGSYPKSQRFPSQSDVLNRFVLEETSMLLSLWLFVFPLCPFKSSVSPQPQAHKRPSSCHTREGRPSGSRPALNLQEPMEGFCETPLTEQKRRAKGL